MDKRDIHYYERCISILEKERKLDKEVYEIKWYVVEARKMLNQVEDKAQIERLEKIINDE